MFKLPLLVVFILFASYCAKGQQQFSPLTFACSPDTAHLVWDRALYHCLSDFSSASNGTNIVAVTDSIIVTRPKNKHLAGLIITRTRQGKLVLHTIRGVGGGGDSGFDKSYETKAAEMALSYIQQGPVKK